MSPPHPESRSHLPASDTSDADSLSAQHHLSETVDIQQWLRLLVVVSSLLLIGVIVFAAVRVLATISHTLLLFSLGALLAYALYPLIERVRQRKTGKPRARWVGVMAVYGGLVLLLGLSVALLSRETVIQVNHLIRDHNRLEAEARDRLASADTWLEARSIHVNLEQYLDNPPPNVRNWGEATAQNTLKALSAFSKSIVEGIIVLLISMYFIIYSGEMQVLINRSLPRRVQPYAEQWESDLNRILGGFVRGQITLAVVMGVTAALLCLVLGVRFWLLIGLFVVVASMVPVIGPVVGAVPAVISAALTPAHHFPHPIAKVVLVILLFSVLNEVGSKVLYPRLVGAALGLHEVLVLFVLFAGLEVGGLIGVLFAAPLTALVIATAVQVHRLWCGDPPISLADLAKRGGKEAQAHGTP